MSLKCSTCNQIKDESHFYKSKRAGENRGYAWECKECKLKYQRDYRKLSEHKPLLNARDRESQRKRRKCAKKLCKTMNILVTQLTCDECGIAYGIPTKEYRNNIRRRRTHHFCSQHCNGVFYGRLRSKKYRETSPYAKKIKQLQKEYK